MAIALEYKTQVAWRTFAKNVRLLTKETEEEPAKYRMKVEPIDRHDMGADLPVDNECYFISYMGNPYTVTNSTTEYIDVRDDYRVGVAPTSSKIGIIYKTVDRSPFIAPVYYRYLHNTAVMNMRKLEMNILWEYTSQLNFKWNPKGVLFSFDQETNTLTHTGGAMNVINWHSQKPEKRFNLGAVTIDTTPVHKAFTVDENSFVIADPDAHYIYAMFPTDPAQLVVSFMVHKQVWRENMYNGYITTLVGTLNSEADGRALVLIWGNQDGNLPDTLTPETINEIKNGKHYHKIEFPPIPEAEITTIIKSVLGNNHESYLIENTANVSETVQSSWTVIPYNEQVGEFKAVVLVRNKSLNTIITLMNILSFDYSDPVKVVQQNPMLTDANITLTVGIDAGTSILYATVSGMTEDNKRIHLCFERCVLSKREIELTAISDISLEMDGAIDIAMELNGTAEMVLDADSEIDRVIELNGTSEMALSMDGELSFDDWFLIAEYVTNSPGSTTFDPLIQVSSGEYKWDIGGVEVLGTSVSMTLDGTNQTIRLYGKGSCVITNVYFNADNIVGYLDLSHTAFSSVTRFYLQTNLLMTGVGFPALITGPVIALWVHTTGVAGVFDLSAFTNFSTSATIYVYANPSMTGVTFASSISGTIAGLYLQENSITGLLDLTMFDNFTSSGAIMLHTNPYLTGVTFASSITGTMSALWFFSTGLSGVLDLSKFTSFTSGSIQLESNPSMTGIIFASSITGTISLLSIYSTGISGVLDLSKFSSFTTSGIIRLYKNPSLTGVTFASSISGTISSLNIYETSLTGVLDLSKFASFSASAVISLHTNPYLTGVTFASSITGTITSLTIYSTGISGVLDLSKFTAFTLTAQIQLHANPSLTGVLFASVISGIVRTLTLYSNTSLGYVDLTKLATGVNLLNWQFTNNDWTATIVNQVLSEINSISASGFTGRNIYIGGSNADPDTTSGGYDGVAALNDLVADGFVVTIT